MGTGSDKSEKNGRSHSMNSHISMRMRAMLALFFFGVVVIDQWTKHTAIAAYATSAGTVLSHMQSVEPCSGLCLSFELVFNRGVTWGLLASEGAFGFLFVCFLILGITALLARYAYVRFRSGYRIFAELLVLAGSISNFLDRVLYGGVVDFIRLSWGEYTWPIFNVADCCIVLGVVVILFQRCKE